MRSALALALVVAAGSRPARAQSDMELLLPGMTSHHVEVNDLRMHYVKAGTGPRLVILLHGFPEFWYGNRNILREFSGSTTYTAVAPDLRGYNLTSRPDSVRDYQVRQLVEDVRQLATTLGHREFDLVGHDWGGIVAWWFGIAHPELLRHLVIINSPHPMTFVREMKNNPAQQEANAYTVVFRSDSGERVLSADNFSFLVNKMRKETPFNVFPDSEMARYREAWGRPGGLTGSLNWYRASRYGSGFEVTDFSVNVPTLVIWGMQDGFILASNLDRLDEYVPQLTIKRIEDGTHWVIHEKPELVNRYLTEFLAK